MFKTKFIGAVFAAAIALLATASSQAQTATVFFSSGNNCSGGTSANYTVGGPAVPVSICANVTGPFACGHTLQLSSASAGENNAFSVTSRTTGSTFATGYVETISPFVAQPIVLAGTGDLGVSYSSGTAATGVANMLLATVNLTPAVGTSNSSYVISFSANSDLITNTNASCTTGLVDNTPLAGTFTLNKLIPPTALTFTATPSPLTFNEGGAAQNVTIACTGTFGTPASVTVTPTSTNPTAFTVPGAALTFSSCAPQTVAVTPRAADAGFNAAQTGNVTFAVSTGGTAPAAVAVTVNDLNVPATYTVTKTTATVTEGSATTDTIVVTCNGSFTAGAPGTVAYSIAGLTAGAGNDYTASPASPLSFATCAGATQAVTITPRTNDTTIQGNRSGTLTLSSPVSGTLSGASTGAINVNDNDVAQAIAISVAGSPATEAGGVLTYTLTRSLGSAEQAAATLTVNLNSPSGSRFDATPASKCGATVAFLANSPTATCTVTGLDNNLPDGNVNAVVSIAAPSVPGAYTGTGNSATGTITDDDFGVSVVAVSSAVTEGQNAVFTIACNGATGSYTANYTITGRDLASVITPPASATSVPLNCVTGASTATVTVSTTDDAIIGNIRSVTLTLNSVVSQVNRVGALAVVVGTPAAASVTILDNDQPLIVPTMSAAGLGLLALLIFGFVAFGQRRRVD